MKCSPDKQVRKDYYLYRNIPSVFSSIAICGSKIGLSVVVVLSFNLGNTDIVEESILSKETRNMVDQS